MALETATHLVVMPAMGDSVAEGTVLAWRKREGDSVQADETIVEISTDKVDAEVPAPVAGTLVKIHVSEGETVPVGAPLAEIATDADVSSSPPPNGGGWVQPEVAGATAEPPASEPAAPPAASGGKTIEIVTPTGGESVSEGTILEWSVKVGDAVTAGQTVVEISTDKIDMELPAPTDGTITEILAGEGENVTVGQVIGRMRTAVPAAADGHDQPVSPIARRAAVVEGVDLAGVHGSARGGRITKADVLAAAGDDGASRAATDPSAGVVRTADAAPAAPQAPAEHVEPIKGGAAALARYMEESRSIPTATSFRSLTVTTLAARRDQLKQAGHRVSFTHLVAYAVARAGTADMPEMAHHCLERDGVPHRADDGAVNLGLAVDVERRDGSRALMVPVIRNAGALSFSDFLQTYNELVDRARGNTLGPDELVGANLTLTNPGGLGTSASVPRLMPGQGAIIATGSIAYPVGLGRVGAAISAEKVMTMTSTYDH